MPHISHVLPALLSGLRARTQAASPGDREQEIRVPVTKATALPEL